MSIKKYQVFVSSTFIDLIEERQDAIRNILDLKHIPASMELFPATDVDQFAYIKKVIDECDYYLLIVGGRYGSVDTDGFSYTEKEYDYAVSAGKIVLAFIHDAPNDIPISKSDTSEEAKQSLKKFRDKIKTGRLVKAWTSRENLEPLVLKALIHAFSDFPQTGWIRGDSAASDHVLEQANNALVENAQLRAEISELKSSEKPKYDDLADLDDMIELRYRTRYRPRAYGDYTYTDRVCSLTWRQIFLTLASNLKTARTDVIILSAFKDAVKEANITYIPHDLNSVDLTKIKVQFVALGLIKTIISNSTDGTVAEFLSLTEKGREIFMSSVVVRKSIPEY